MSETISESSSDNVKVECPVCSLKMTVHVKLARPRNVRIECLRCHREIDVEAIAPGKSVVAVGAEPDSV